MAWADVAAFLPLILLVVVFFGVMYFFMVRPQRRRQQEHNELIEGLKRGDRVITAGGIYGEIESLDDESIVIKVESGASIRVARGSVAGKRERRQF